MEKINKYISNISELLVKKNNIVDKIELLNKDVDNLTKVFNNSTSYSNEDNSFYIIIKDKIFILIKDYNDQIYKNNTYKDIIVIQITQLKHLIYNLNDEKITKYLKDFLSYNKLTKKYLSDFILVKNLDWLKIKIEFEKYSNNFIENHINFNSTIMEYKCSFTKKEIKNIDKELFIIFYELYINVENLFDYINYINKIFILKKKDYSSMLYERIESFKLPQYFYTITLWNGLKSIKIGNKIHSFDSPTLDEVRLELGGCQFRELCMYNEIIE